MRISAVRMASEPSTLCKIDFPGRHFDDALFKHRLMHWASARTTGEAMQVIAPRLSDLGGGFFVNRALPNAARRAVGPFVFFDAIGPTQLPAGQGVDVRPHPHIGLATVSYLFDGEIVHRDSLGSVATLLPGGVNWMTDGRGIVHSERPPAHVRLAGARAWGLQLWVTLPLELEDRPPAFAHTGAADIPQVELSGTSIRVVLGEAYNARSPVAVISPMLLLAARQSKGTSLSIDHAHSERAAYVVEGSVRIGMAHETVRECRLVTFESDEEAVVTASDGAAHIVVLGGPPLDAPRFVWWNFVSSQREPILAAQAAWEAQDPSQFPHVPGDAEYIPPPPAPVLSERGSN